MTYLLWFVAIFIMILIVMSLVPFTYDIYAKRGETNTAYVKARWIGKLFRVFWEYTEAGDVNREIYILGKLRAGAAKDYQIWLARKVQAELAEEDLYDSEIDENIAKTQSNTKSEVNKPAIKNSGVRLDIKKNKENELEAVVHPEDREKINACKPCDKIKQTTKEKVDKLYTEAKQKYQNKKEEYAWLTPLWDKRVFNASIKLVARIYNHSKPRKWELDGVIGTGDPAYTAMLEGFMHATMSTQVKKVRFEYMEAMAKGSLYCKGRIYLPKLIWYFICFAWTKPIRQVIINKM